MRETVIKRSRDVLKLAKTAIYCLHRKQMELAERNAAEAQTIVTEELLPLVASLPQLRWGGALSQALEEYAEARVFQAYLVTGKVPGPSAPGLGGVVTRDEFVGGVMDFIGELTRVTVLAATARDEVAVARGREVVEDIQMALMGFDFRNGQLRRKFDALKYSLKKIEQVRRPTETADSCNATIASLQVRAPPWSSPSSCVPACEAQITYELSLTKALGGFAMESRTMQPAEEEEDDGTGEAARDSAGGGGRGGMGRGRKGAAVQASLASASKPAGSVPGAKRSKASGEAE